MLFQVRHDTGRVEILPGAKRYPTAQYHLVQSAFANIAHGLRGPPQPRLISLGIFEAL